MRLRNFDIDAFLRESWQKTPLLIRNPWVAWINPIDGDELAGLACEDHVEARLITHKRGQWAVEHGPLPEERLRQPEKDPWTLLVQAVDHHVPDVAVLIDIFRFIPNWRVDDVMVSYAVDGGGVGPHFDQYDVFLIQGAGTRRWQIGAACDADTPLLPNDDVRLLAAFEPTQEWVLEPGDILYVPPRFAHNGVAVGDDCMTYSIGFRAPARSELVEGWCDYLVDAMQDEDRYEDPDLRLQDNPGEISAPAVARLHAMVTDAMRDRDAFARWFGQYSSTPKYPDIDWRPEEPVELGELRDLLDQGAWLCRNPASRFSFIRQADEALLLFVDGESFDCAGVTGALAERICGIDRVQARPAEVGSDAAMTLLLALVNQGSLAFESDA